MNFEKQKKIFDNAEKNYWDDILRDSDLSVEIITTPDLNKRTLLHLVCKAQDRERALPVLKKIFVLLKEANYIGLELTKFLNARDDNGITSLQLASQWGHTEMIDIIVSKGADIWLPFEHVIDLSENYHIHLLRFFDQGLHLHRDQYDESNESLWILSCDFSVFTGRPFKLKIRERTLDPTGLTSSATNSSVTATEVIVTSSSVGTNDPPTINNDEILDTANSPENSPVLPVPETDSNRTANSTTVNANENFLEEPETRKLSRILCLPWAYCSDVCMHPLVQFFVFNQVKKYQLAIWLSVFYHITWNLLAGIFLFGALINVPAAFNNVVNNNTQFNISQSNASANDLLPDFSKGTNVTAINLTESNTKAVNNNATTYPINLISSVYHITWICIIRWIFLFFAAVKELAELIILARYTRKKCLIFHFKQLETICQWILVPVVILAEIDVLPRSYIFGITAAIVSIQMQFGRCQKIGIFTRKIIQIVKCVLKYIFYFAFPLLAFGFTFNVFWPDQPSFAWPTVLPKTIVAFATGELNFDELFAVRSNSNEKQLLLTEAAFMMTFFVLVFVVAFVAYVVSYAVNDLEKMENEAIACQVASMLALNNLFEEMFYMFNTFWCKPATENEASSAQNVSYIRKCFLSIWKRITDACDFLLENIPKTPTHAPKIGSLFTFHQYFERIPKNLRIQLYLNKHIFPNGYKGRHSSEL